MSEIWFTADTHFGHQAMSAEGKGWRPFTTTAEHDARLMHEWNTMVRPHDQVWHLGDVGMGPSSRTLAIVSKLHGTKHLIAGNHDPVWPGHRDAHKYQRAWLEAFTSVQPFARRRVGKIEFLMSHFPYAGDHTETDRFEWFRLRDSGAWLVHGHVHGAWKRNDRQVNVGVDVWNWRPINLSELLDEFQKA